MRFLQMRFFPSCRNVFLMGSLHGHLGVSLVSVNIYVNKWDGFGKVYRFGVLKAVS